MDRKTETGVVARVQSDDFAKIFNWASMLMVVIAVGHMFTTQLHISPPEPQRQVLGPRILLGDEDSLESKAKAYQELYGLAKSRGYYSHFAQQVGESYTAYYNGKPFTPEEKTAVDHAFCATGKPRSRYYHASALVPHSGNVSNLFGNLQPKSLMFIFGGRRAQAFNDGWVFVNGVIDGKQWGEGDNASKRTYNPLSGKSCNECPDYSTTACKGKALSCNACNQWHKARLSFRTRTSVECDVFHTWCPTSDVNFHYKKTNSSEKVYRSEHAMAFVYKDAEHAGQGTMFMHGGQGATIGATRTLWYLDRMPIPTSGVDKTAQYEADMTAEWRCAKVYGNLESSDSYHTSLFRSYNAGCEGTTPDIRTAMSGMIDSGVPRPQHRCSWIVEPPENGKHIIAFEFTRLDLSDSDAYVCENWIMIEEVWHSNETDYVLHLIKTSPTFANGDDGSYIKKKLLHGSLVENRKTLTRVCSMAQLENNYFSTSHINASMHITLRYDSFCPANPGVGGNYTIIPDGDPMLSCPRTCPTILPCLTTCNNNGICKGGRCHCKRGFHGAQCERQCIREDGCGSDRGTFDDFYPTQRLSHSLLASYRYTVSKVLNVTETGEHPTNNCVVTKQHLTPIINGNDELGENYAFVRTNVSSIAYTMSGGGKTKVVTMTESISITEGFTRLILFGGWSNLVVSDELWTLDVQDQLGDVYDSENCPSFEGLSNCTNFNLTLCHGKGVSDIRRHPQFPTLPRWNKWSIPVLSGSERPQGRFGHSAVLSGRYRVGQKTLLTKDQLGDRMLIFGGQGQTNVLNDVWELNIPQAPGQVWEWKPFNFSMPRISTFYFPGDGLVRVTFEEAGIELGGRINIVESPLKLISGKWHITKTIDPYTVEFNVTEKRDQESHAVGLVRAMSLPIGKSLHGGKISTQAFPLPRRHAASSMFQNKTIGQEVLVVYGGFDGMVALNDIWVLNVNEEDSTKYAWFRILEGVSGRGVWAAGIGWKPFWFFGVRIQEESSEEMLPRYGHTMMTMTSSVDGSGDYTDVLLAYGGMGSKRISTEINVDHYGFVWGGKNGDMTYVCPSVDIACAHTTFKGTACQASPKQPLIGFLVIVQIFYFVGFAY